MGITDIQVQAKNMVIRGPDGLMFLTKYDPNDLTKTVKVFVESKLADSKESQTAYLAILMPNPSLYSA